MNSSSLSAPLLQEVFDEFSNSFADQLRHISRQHDVETALAQLEPHRVQ
jgi:hypothetical protein